VAWGLWPCDEEEELSDIEDIANEQLTRCLEEAQIESDSISTLRDAIRVLSAVENDLSRSEAISTLQRSLLSKLTSSSVSHSKLKPHVLLQVGGSSLNLLQEDIGSVGRTIQFVDIKGKKSKRQTWNAMLPHSTVFMGLTVFGNKAYICGGRNAIGSSLLGEESPNVHKAMHLLNPET
jgi:hypothetical protein